MTGYDLLIDLLGIGGAAKALPLIQWTWGLAHIVIPHEDVIDLPQEWRVYSCETCENFSQSSMRSQGPSLTLWTCLGGMARV
jgi:hypothetical protein